MKKQAAGAPKDVKVVKRVRKSHRAPVRYTQFYNHLNRLWVKAVFLGFRRSKHLQNES